MKLRHLYLIIALSGTLIPYFFFLRFLLKHGLNVALFYEQMPGTKIAAFFTWDVVISTLVVLTFVFTEGQRLPMKTFWFSVSFNLLVGISLALPAFLYARQKQMDQSDLLSSSYV